MKIGVMSDTHLRSPDPTLEFILDDLFKDADVILHAGDIVTRRVLDRLDESGVIAVCGNMDDYGVADAIPQVRIIPANGIRIGLIHGWGSKEGLEARIAARFAAEVPDVIVYGHSHVPFFGKVKGVTMFNPGAASRNRDTGVGTVGVLDIRDGKIHGNHLPLQR